MYKHVTRQVSVFPQWFESGSPEGGRQQYQQSENLQPTQQHADTQNPLPWGADSGVVFGDGAKPWTEIFKQAVTAEKAVTRSTPVAVIASASITSSVCTVQKTPKQHR
ncbi:MAG: hypothetical protein Ct9H300mP14_06070 [Gammaproteobacteria bacterium]|nr:MAG: hypothetical protein Ct9H300mP14_06070 [Gammaproteobacteria bacterium]